MTAIDDLRRSLGQVPKGTPVSVIIGHAGDDQVFLVDAGPLFEELGPAKAPPLLWAMPLAPVEGMEYPPKNWTRSNWRGAPYTLGDKPSRHTGDDLDQPGETDRGEPCYAIRKGTVVWAGRIPEGSWGNLVVIRHKDDNGETFYARYGHLDAIRVDPGQGVVAGQWIGNVGRTGSESGAFKYSHLHFDITNPGDVTLEQNPTHWPWNDLETIMRVYADPGVFLRARITPPPTTGAWRKVVVTSSIGLKVRAAPTTSSLQLDVLPNGVTVEVSEATTKADGYDWAQRKSGRGYLAVKFTRPFDPAAPKPIVYAKPKALLGWNLIGPGAFNVLYQYPKPLGTCTVINEPKWCMGLSSEWVNYRDKSDGLGRQEPDPSNWLGKVWKAIEWHERYWPKLAPARRESGRKLMITEKNEVFRVEMIDWWVAFDMDLIDVYVAKGLVGTYGNFSVAVFEGKHVPKLKRLVEYGAAKGMILSFNTYWYGGHPDAEKRLAYARPLLDAVPYAPFIVNETGSEPNDALYPGFDAMGDILRRTHTLYAGYPGCLGIVGWGINGSGGGQPQSHIPDQDVLKLATAF